MKEVLGARDKPTKKRCMEACKRRKEEKSKVKKKKRIRILMESHFIQGPMSFELHFKLKQFIQL